MKAIGVIPARYGSTRFPGKPLVKILGKSLIERVYNQASRADLDRVIVATDDERIIDEVSSFGGSAVMTGEHNSGTDRIAEAVKNEACDFVVNIQGDEPLIDPQVIDIIAQALENNEWADVTTATVKIINTQEIDNPNVNKVVFTKDGKALYFSRSRIPSNRNSAPNTSYFKHIGIYGFRKDFLNTFVSLPRSSLEIAESLEQLRVIENGYDIHVSIVDYDSIGVDVPEDVKRVEEMIKKMKHIY